jgi:hypothetical protein
MILYKIKNLQETLQSVENEINSLDKKEWEKRIYV